MWCQNQDINSISDVFQHNYSNSSSSRLQLWFIEHPLNRLISKVIIFTQSLRSPRFLTGIVVRGHAHAVSYGRWRTGMMWCFFILVVCTVSYLYRYTGRGIRRAKMRWKGNGFFLRLMLRTYDRSFLFSLRRSVLVTQNREPSTSQYVRYTVHALFAIRSYLRTFGPFATCLYGVVCSTVHISATRHAYGRTVAYVHLVSDPVCCHQSM